MISAVKLSVFVFLSTVLIIHSYSIEDAWAQTNSKVSVPDWIKNNAAWWAEGQIDDQTFVDGIEYMVKNELIRSPTLSIVEDNTTEETQNIEIIVPDWIKNNAAWWAEGQIDDQTFVDGIEYMVKNEIIRSPNIVIIEKSELIQEENKIKTNDTQPESEKEDELETNEEVVNTFVPPTPKELPHQEPEIPQTGEIKVLVIDGKNYPLKQFWSSESSKCDDETIWRTDTGKAIDIDGQSINEGTDGCRFGITAEIAEEIVEISNEQIQNFEELTGIKIT